MYLDVGFFKVLSHVKFYQVLESVDLRLLPVLTVSSHLGSSLLLLSFGDKMAQI